VFRKPTLLALGAAAAALAAAGCGGGGSSSGSSASTSAAPASSAPSAANTTSKTSAPAVGGQTVALSADPGGALKFSKSSLSAKAGTVTLKMTNPASLQHGIAVEGHGVDKDGPIVGNGGTSTVTVKLKPGTYEFYCPVPGHRQAGMQGKLVVK
jgi:uncharacterized cupredoxin-like copper-binding protein